MSLGNMSLREWKCFELAVTMLAGVHSASLVLSHIHQVWASANGLLNMAPKDNLDLAKTIQQATIGRPPFEQGLILEATAQEILSTATVVPSATSLSVYDPSSFALAIHNPSAVSAPRSSTATATAIPSATSLSVYDPSALALAIHNPSAVPAPRLSTYSQSPVSIDPAQPLLTPRIASAIVAALGLGYAGYMYKTRSKRRRKVVKKKTASRKHRRARTKR